MAIDNAAAGSLGSLVMRILFLFLFFFSTLQSASIEEMVGEMLLVHFHGEKANADSKRLIEEVHVGGFIFFNWTNGLTDPEQVQELTRSLQAQASKPLLLGVDQEGGRVLRLKNGFSAPPPNGSLKSPDEAYAWARKVGSELKQVGINLNLAPVADVNSNPDNPVIGNRSYSNDPQIVADMAAAALRGYKEAGVIAVLKHFPGHGDTHIDSHFELPVINKDRAELDLSELYPFRCCAHQAPVIMTAHLLIPQIDTKPVTVSKRIVENLLITEIGYDGLVMTDSLAMKGILTQTPEDIAIAAISAGHDLILLAGGQLTGEGFEFTVEDVVQIHRKICDAVRNGVIDLGRIRKSHDKIINLKNKTFQPPFTAATPSYNGQEVHSPQHRRFLTQLCFERGLIKSRI